MMTPVPPILICISVYCLYLLIKMVHIKITNLRRKLNKLGIDLGRTIFLN